MLAAGCQRSRDQDNTGRHAGVQRRRLFRSKVDIWRSCSRLHPLPELIDLFYWLNNGSIDHLSVDQSEEQQSSNQLNIWRRENNDSFPPQPPPPPLLFSLSRLLEWAIKPLHLCSTTFSSPPSSLLCVHPHFVNELIGNAAERLRPCKQTDGVAG